MPDHFVSLKVRGIHIFSLVYLWLLMSYKNLPEQALNVTPIYIYMIQLAQLVLTRAVVSNIGLQFFLDSLPILVVCQRLKVSIMVPYVQRAYDLLLRSGIEGPKSERITKDRYEKDTGANVEGPKEAEYKQLKVEAKYQGLVGKASSKRKSYI